MQAATKEQDHAYQNASGWASTIAELVAALECDYDRLETLNDERDSAASESDGGISLATFDASDDGEEWRELTAAATLDGEVCKDADAARERIEESPLSVEVRSGWCTPGGEDYAKPEDFRILLSTGGPALQIRGDLNEHGEPDRAWLEYQDWGTPWTEYHGEGCEQETLLTFCRQFYFGE